MADDVADVPRETAALSGANNAEHPRDPAATERPPVLLPSAPASAAALCGDALPKLTRYAEMLADTGVTHGLIGPREVPRLWERHVLNSAAVAPALPRDAAVLDVGSGAGLPGIVLAVLRPDVTMTLLEPLVRRVQFLERAITDLGLVNVAVVRGRAEDHAGSLLADVVTSRAVAPLGRLTQWSLPLLRPHGFLLAIKGRTAAEEIAASLRELRAAGATSWEIEVWGSDILAEPTTVVRVVRGGSSASRRPTRRVPERRT